MNSRFTSFADIESHLHGLGLFHMDLTLARAQAVLPALSLTRPPFTSIQVVGTNGKGSTSTILAALLQAHGIRVGLYTSPHFLSVRERISINGAPLPDKDWVRAANAVAKAMDGLEPVNALTYFEFLTVLAARAFAEAGVQAAVFEAGLGGANDATTVLAHHLLVLTSIGMDHQSVLGPNLEDIARDKAGAMRRGVPALTSRQDEEVAAVLRAEAKKRGVVLFQSTDILDFSPEFGIARPCRQSVHPVIEDLTLGLPGAFQEHNARLALAAFYLLCETNVFEPDPLAIRDCLATIRLPGRMQRYAPPGRDQAFLLDAAHNPPGLTALRRSLDLAGLKPSAVIFTCLRDKNLPLLGHLIRAMTKGPVIVPEIEAGDRARPAAEVARAIKGAEAVKDIDAALAAVADRKGLVLVCGSMYLLSAFYARFPEALNP